MLREKIYSSPKWSPPPPPPPPALSSRPYVSRLRSSGLRSGPHFDDFWLNCLPEELSESATHSTPISSLDELGNLYPAPLRIYTSLPLDNEESDPEETSHFHKLTAPFVQVFSVRLHTNFNDNHHCGIYGTITVADDYDGADLTMYDRQNYDSEIIHKKDFFLSLTGPRLNGSLSAISGSRGATMHLALRDSVRDVELINNQLKFESMIEEVDSAYDRIQSAIVKGSYGNVTVYYATVLYGVMANLEVLFVNDVDYGADPPSDVYLEVTAQFGSSKWYRSKDDNFKSLEILLVRRPLNEFVEQAGSSTLLSGHAVVVPVYSSLIVKAKCGKNYLGSVEFSAASRGQYVHKFEVKNGHVRVNVRWTHGYSRLTQQISGWGSGVPAITVSRNVLVEVFSIRVCGINHDVRDVSGEVTIEDGGFSFYIFQKDASLLSDDETLSLHIPEKVTPNSNFSLELNLKDPMQGLELSVGVLDWTCCSLVNGEFTWYDKRLCSVIWGKDGFAAVHHMVLYDGVQAAIEAKIYFHGSSEVATSIYGSLCVRYGDYEYLSSYEQKYFKTRLFSRKKNDPLWLASGEDIPLTRCSVAAPRSSSLIIEVNLKAASGFKEVNFPEEELCAEAEFQVNLDTAESQKMIGSRRFCFMMLSVKWDD